MSKIIEISIRLGNIEKIQENIEAVKRAIPRCDPQGKDPRLLEDTLSILEGIKKELEKKSFYANEVNYVY